MTTPKDITINTLNILNTIVLPQLKACRSRQELNNYLTSAIEEGHIGENPYFLIQLWELQNGVLKEGQHDPLSRTRRPADVVTMDKTMENVRESALRWKETIYQRNSKHPLKVADLVKLKNINTTPEAGLKRRGATGMVLVTKTRTSLAHYVVGKNVETGEEVRFEVKWKGADGDWVAWRCDGIDNGTDYPNGRDEWKPTLMAA